MSDDKYKFSFDTPPAGTPAGPKLGLPGEPAANSGYRFEVAPGDPEPAMARAKAAFQNGRFDVAEQICRMVIDEHPTYIGARALLGLTLGQKGMVPQGINVLRDVVAADPTIYGAINGLASMLFHIGRFEESSEYRHKALELRPQDPAGWNELGMCLLAMNHPTEAIECCRRALVLSPGSPQYHHNMGLAFERLGFLRDAEESYERAVMLDPKAPQNYGALARLLFYQGRREEGLAWSRKAYAAQPHSTDARLQMSRVFSEERDFEGAQRLLSEALAAEPKSVAALSMQGHVYQQQGRFSDAQSSLEAALEIDPRYAEAYLLMVTGKKLTPADQDLVSRMVSLSNTPELLASAKETLSYALGKAYDDLGDYGQAIGQYDRANQLAEVRTRGVRPVFDHETLTRGYSQTIESFTPEFLSSQKRYGSDSEQPIFVVGMIRSGTTLVEQILSSHPEIYAGGELPFWMDEGKKIHHELPAKFDLAELSRLQAQYLDLLSKISPKGNSKPKYTTDKMPQNFMALGLMHVAFPNAKIVHCRRHPVDTAISIYATPYGGPPAYAYVRENIVFMYRQYQRIMQHWRAVLPPDRFIEVDYESVVADREREARGMLDFLGLEWDEAVMHHEKNARVVQTPSLWQTRQPIYSTSVERWRRYEPWLGVFRELLPEPA